MKEMEKIIRKPGSEPRTALKAKIRGAPGGFDTDLPAWLTATLAALTESGNCTHFGTMWSMFNRHNSGGE